MNNREEDKGSCGERPRLPDPDELVPLTQALIPLGLASAFKIVTDTKPGNGSSKKLNGNGSSNNNNNSMEFPLSQAQCQRALDMNPEKGSSNNNNNHIDISRDETQILRTQRASEGNPSFRPENGSSNSIEISPQSQSHSHSHSQRGLSFLPNVGTLHHLKIASMLPIYEEDNAHSLASNRKAEHNNGYMVTDMSLENGLSNIPLKATFEDGGGGGGGGGGGDSSCGGIQYENLNEDPADPDPDPDPDPSGSGARTLKRPRLVWTPQLHKRFVDAVAHLGIKGAVPKTIMQLMNVEGLTRENVASHLQKYRLYLKRMQGLPSDIMHHHHHHGGSSSSSSSVSDQLFASTPVPPGLVSSTTHFLSNNNNNNNNNNGDDVMMPLVMPMPMSMSMSMSMPMSMSIPMPMPMPMPMGGMYDHNNMYTTTMTNGAIRPSSSSSSSQNIFSGDKAFLMVDGYGHGHGHSPSPQKQVLTLFPN